MDILDIITHFQNMGNDAVVDLLCDALQEYKEYLMDEDYKTDFSESSDDDMEEGEPEGISITTTADGKFFCLK